MAVAVAEKSELERLPEPTAYLPPEQENIWRMVIASRGGDLIAPEAYPILVDYCRAVDASNQIAAQVDAYDPEWLKDNDGLKRWRILHQMQSQAAADVNRQARSLRLTPQSRVQKTVAGVNADKGPKRKPWESED